MTALPRAPAGRPSFGDFMAGDHWASVVVASDFPKCVFPDDQDRRLHLAAGWIDSLTKLQTWARERFPTWYGQRSGGNYDGPTGKQIVEQYWAAYLAWAEAEA